jgi:achaete-scute complex protein
MPSPTNGRRRNERERQRVRSVNEGFERLRRYVPMSHQCQDASECVVATVSRVRKCQRRRCSKVDVLRAAILYIRHLEGLLDEEGLHWRTLKHNKRKKKKENMALQPKQLTYTDIQLPQTRRLWISERFQRNCNKSITVDSMAGSDS